METLTTFFQITKHQITIKRNMSRNSTSKKTTATTRKNNTKKNKSKKRKDYDGRDEIDVNAEKIIKLSDFEVLAKEALSKKDKVKGSLSNSWKYPLIFNQQKEDINQVDPSLIMFTMFTHTTDGEKGQNADFKHGGYIHTPQHCGSSLSDFGILTSLQCLRDGLIATTDQMLHLVYNHLRELGLKMTPIHELQEKYHPDKTLGIDTQNDYYITPMHMIYGFYCNDIHRYESTEKELISMEVGTNTSSTDVPSAHVESKRRKLELEKLELEKQKLDFDREKSQSENREKNKKSNTTTITAPSSPLLFSNNEYSNAPPSTPWSISEFNSLPSDIRNMTTPRPQDGKYTDERSSSNAMKNLYGLSEYDDIEFQSLSKNNDDDEQQEHNASQEQQEAAFSLSQLSFSQFEDGCIDEENELMKESNDSITNSQINNISDTLIESLENSVNYDRYDKFVEELDERKIQFSQDDQRDVHGAFLKDPNYFQIMSQTRYNDKKQRDEIENHLFFADEYLSSIIKVSCGKVEMNSFLHEFFYAEKEPNLKNYKKYMKNSEKRNMLIEKNNFGKILLALLAPIEYTREMFNENTEKEVFDRLNDVYDLKNIGAVDTDGSVDFQVLNQHRLKWSARIVKWMDKMMEDIYRYLKGFYDMFTVEGKEKKDFFNGNRKERKHTNLNCHNITQILDIIQRLFADTSEGVKAKETFAEYGLRTKFDEDIKNDMPANIPDHWCMNRRELYDATNIVATCMSAHSAKINRTEYPESTIRVMNKVYKPKTHHYEKSYVQPNDKRLKRLFK